MTAAPAAALPRAISASGACSHPRCPGRSPADELTDALAEIATLRAERDAAVASVQQAALWTIEPGTTLEEIKDVLDPLRILHGAYGSEDAVVPPMPDDPKDARIDLLEAALRMAEVHLLYLDRTYVRHAKTPDVIASIKRAMEP